MANVLNMKELLGTSYYFLRQYFGTDVPTSGYDDFIPQNLKQKQNLEKQETGANLIEDVVEDIVGVQAVGSTVLENKKGEEIAQLTFTELPTLYSSMNTSSVGLEIVPGRMVEDKVTKTSVAAKSRPITEAVGQSGEPSREAAVEEYEDDTYQVEDEDEHEELDNRQNELPNDQRIKEVKPDVVEQTIKADENADEQNEAADELLKTIEDKEKQQKEIHSKLSDIEMKKLTLAAATTATSTVFGFFSKSPEQTLQESLIATATSTAPTDSSKEVVLYDDEQNALNTEELQAIENETNKLVTQQPAIPKDLIAQVGVDVNETIKKVAEQKALAENIKNTLIHLENNKKIIEDMNKKFTEVSSELDIEKQLTQITEIRDTLKNMIDKNIIYASVQDIEDIKKKNKENITAYGSIMAKVVLKIIELNKKQKEIKSKKEEEEAIRQKSKVDYENAIRTLEATITEKKDEINRTIEEINKQTSDTYKYKDGDTLENITNKIQQLNNIIQKLSTESTQLESSYSDINTQLVALGKHNNEAYKKEKGIDNIEPTIEKVKLSIKEAESYNEELKLQQSKIEGFEGDYQKISDEIDSLQESVTRINNRIEKIKSSDDDYKTKEARITEGLRRLIIQATTITKLYETINTLAETTNYTKANDGIKEMEKKSNAAKMLVEKVNAYLVQLRESNKTKQKSTRTVNIMAKSTGQEDEAEPLVDSRQVAAAWNEKIQRQSKDTQDVSTILRTLDNFLIETNKSKEEIRQKGIKIAGEGTPLKDAETELENIKRQYESIKLKNKGYKNTAQALISDKRINDKLETIQNSIDEIENRIETAELSIQERRSKKKTPLFEKRNTTGKKAKSDELVVEDLEGISGQVISGQPLQGPKTSTDEDYDETYRMLEPEFEKTRKAEEARRQADIERKKSEIKSREEKKRLQNIGVSNSQKQAKSLLLNNDLKTARYGGGKKTKRQRHKKNKTKKRHT
jgi:hypothetical protein